MGFFERYKKIIVVVGFLLMVFALGYLLYYVFFKQVLTPSVEQPISTSSDSGLPQSGTGFGGQIVKPGEEMPLTGDKTVAPGTMATTTVDDIARGGITKITSLTKVPSYGITLDGNNVKFYNAEDGKFYTVDPNGNSTPLSDKTFYKVSNITWSPDKNKTILEYPDGANIIYDFKTEKQITLPEHWKDFSFSPTGDQIVMKSIGKDPSNRWLAITSTDGNKVFGVEKLNDDASVHPDWSPNQQMVAMYTDSIGLDRQEVYFVGLNKENFKSTIVEGRDFRPMWSPQGDKLVYSVYSSESDLKPTLWTVDASGNSIGNNRKKIELDTWADKCTFANNTTMYCGVPKSLERGAGLMPKIAENTPDDIYKINLETGVKQKIAIPQQDITVSEISVSSDGKYLFLNDSKTNNVQKIDLK